VKLSGDVMYAPALYQRYIELDPAYYHYVLMHEILHALGLKHPHDGPVELQLPAALDRLERTIMSYTPAKLQPLWPVEQADRGR
jgi:hypothetical protein